MLEPLLKSAKTALLLLVLLSVLTGLFYPILITGLAQGLFPWEANGSLQQHGSTVVGSTLIGQYVDDPRYFWGRPSATQPFPYNAIASSGSNLGPTNPQLYAAIQSRVEHLKAADSQNIIIIPIDLVTSSGSGLDPDISPNGAFYQVSRVAKARNLQQNEVEILVYRAIRDREWGLLGEPRVNVLQLNMALDRLSAQGVANGR